MPEDSIASSERKEKEIDDQYNLLHFELNNMSELFELHDFSKFHPEVWKKQNSE